MTLLEAIRAHDEAAVRASLAAGASPESIEDDSGMTALACAVDENQPALVRILLTAGAGAESGRPLYHAVQSGRIECLALLLAAGADPNPVGDEDPPPLYAGAADPAVVDALLKAGADPNRATGLDETPLSFCVSWCELASARLLLAAGADPNHRMRELDWPILFFAAQEGDEDVVQALLDAGADPGVVNERGQTAASVALDHRRTAVAPLLLALGGSGFGPSVGSLRARLRIARPVVDLDVQNVGPDPIDFTGDDPTALRWELIRDGVAVPPRWGRMDVLCSPRTVRLARGMVATFRVSHGADPAERADPVDLDLVTAAWRVLAGDVLRCTIAGGASASAPC